MKRTIILCISPLILGCALSLAQTRVDLRSQSKSVDFGDSPSTRPVKVGTAMPAVCTTGDLFFRSSAAPGSNLYACTATNAWTLLTGGGGSIAPGPPNTFMSSDGVTAQWRLFSAGPSGAVSVSLESGGATVDLDTTIVPRKAMSETVSGLWTFAKGILAPPMTPPPSPAEGQIYIDSSNNLLRWYAGGVMRTAGTGGGDTFGSSGTTAGQMTIFSDTSGKLLGKYTGTGVLKASSGVAGTVSGNAADCVKVDGSSGACGGGSAGPFSPQAPFFLLPENTTNFTGIATYGGAYKVSGLLKTFSYALTVARLATLINTAAAGEKALLAVYSPDGLTKYCEVILDAGATGAKGATCGPVTLPAGTYALVWATSNAGVKIAGISASNAGEDAANLGATPQFFYCANPATAAGMPATLGTRTKSNLIGVVSFIILGE